MTNLEEDQLTQNMYYKTFSNKLNSEIVTKKEYEIITPKDYFDKNISLKKYKLDFIKNLLRHYKLRLTGNKQILTERLENYFDKHKKSIILQKTFRGHLVRYSFKLRGPAFKNRECTNSTDFYTMEPLNEIEFERFFSYADNKGFIYGFDIFSLVHLYHSKHKLINPYNREEIDRVILQKLLTLGKIAEIIFPNFNPPRSPVARPPVQQTHIQRRYVLQQPTILNQAQNTQTQQLHTPPTAQIYRPTYLPQNNIMSRLREIANRPLNTRIREAFMEIDNLGNYTDVEWFMSLTSTEYLTFYLQYYNLWRRLDSTIRENISPNGNPFGRIAEVTRNLNREQNQTSCIELIENMIYSGTNIEYRRLGALHVLTLLTRVSLPARAAIPWLNDIVVY
jgi:hypothetical protein